MIHQLLCLTRPLFVLDCETTGIDPQSDRIVEIAFECWESEGGMVKEWRTLVNPGVPIPEAATKVHGITNGIIADGRPDPGNPEGGIKPWPTFKQLAPRLAKGFSDCDFAGKNVRFDLRIVAAEMQRAEHPWNYVGAQIIDIDRLEQLAVPRDLASMHEKYTGRKHDGAHGALSDVHAATTVIVRQLEVHEQLPRDLDTLHALQWQGWIDTEGKFRFIDSVACFTNWGKFKNRPMHTADVGYWDFILRENFSVEVKQIAADAKLGKFPEEKHE